MLEEYLPFEPFNSYEPVRFYRRRLPHLRQDRCTYFVTTRLADSIPRKVVETWSGLREQWLAAHGLSDQLSPDKWKEIYRAIHSGEREAFEREQAKMLFRELDKCLGAAILRSPEYATEVKKSFTFFDPDRLQCGDFVVMPNHVHWLVRPMEGYELEDVLKSVNQFSAKQINRLAGRSGRLWYKEPYDRLVRNRVELDRTRAYIQQNPEKANLPVGSYLYYRADWLDE